MTDKLMSEEEILAHPLHMQTDYYKRNENIKNGKKLCKECGGTGNYFLSKYKKCPHCDHGATNAN